VEASGSDADTDLSGFIASDNEPLDTTGSSCDSSTGSGAAAVSAARRRRLPSGVERGKHRGKKRCVSESSEDERVAGGGQAAEERVKRGLTVRRCGREKACVPRKEAWARLDNAVRKGGGRAAEGQDAQYWLEQARFLQSLAADALDMAVAAARRTGGQ
jgi:hypothetical protein